MQAEDPSLFWFGTSYRERCEEGEEGAGHRADCYNPRHHHGPDSLLSRLLALSQLPPDTLDRYLTVTYTTQPGECSITCRNLSRGRIHEGPSRYRDHKANRPDSYGPLTCSEEAVFMKAGQQGPQRVFLNHDLVTDCACVLKGMCTFSTR